MPAIDGISFDIAPGEVLGVVGESGAGKSVTGAAIIGLIEPPGRIAGGEVRLRGRRIDDLPAEAMRRIRGKRIGMVFQDSLTSLNPLYRIGDQLVETITTHADMSAAAARRHALSLLSEVGIPAPEMRIDNYPHQFSGGMRQRVVLALALAPEPELIIADEPTTALDVSVQAQIIALIRRLARQRGAAVMLITHDMGVIAETADRVAVMYAGRLVEIGPVRDVVKAPLHPYTRGTDGLDPDARCRCRTARADPGRHAAAHRDPERMRVPSALSAGVRALRDDAARARARRRARRSRAGSTGTRRPRRRACHDRAAAGRRSRISAASSTSRSRGSTG